MTTGLAFRIKGQLHTAVAFTPTEVLDMLGDADVVVAERFATAGLLSAPGLHTIEVFGAIRGYCYAKGVAFHEATPAMRYSHMKDAEAAKGKGKLIEPSDVARHEVDALAHLLAWEYRNVSQV